MKKALDSVNERILAAVSRRPPSILATSHGPRLVAVSKLKPVSSLIEAYECGQRYFGENYIQELEEKSNNSEILEKCPDIKFHFIGHLQKNKVNRLLRVKNLHMVETIDSMKIADLVNKAIDLRKAEPIDHEFNLVHATWPNDRLKVMVQVNTSGEEQKNGIPPEGAPNLAKHIIDRCPRLEFAGIMTIGKFEGWDGPNRDFIRMCEIRDELSRELSLEPQSIELSMGMSGDFEEAISRGSTSVRVGTLIFGERK